MIPKLIKLESVVKTMIYGIRYYTNKLWGSYLEKKNSTPKEK